MSYLAYLLSIIEMVTSGKTAGEPFLYTGLKQFLDGAVRWNEIFLTVSLVIAGIAALIVTVSIFAAKASHGRKQWIFNGMGAGCGCSFLFLLLLPLLQLLDLWITRGLASSVSLEGITDPTKFWLLLALIVLLGSG